MTVAQQPQQGNPGNRPRAAERPAAGGDFAARAPQVPDVVVMGIINVEDLIRNVNALLALSSRTADQHNQLRLTTKFLDTLKDEQVEPVTVPRLRLYRQTKNRAALLARLRLYGFYTLFGLMIFAPLVASILLYTGFLLPEEQNLERLKIRQKLAFPLLVIGWAAMNRFTNPLIWHMSVTKSLIKDLEWQNDIPAEATAFRNMDLPNGINAEPFVAVTTNDGERPSIQWW